MFARRISFALQPGCAAEFTRITEEEALPLMRETKGFREELVLLSEDGLQAVNISFWNSKEEALSFDHCTYAALLRLFTKVVAGSPVVDSYVVAPLKKQIRPFLMPAVGTAW